MPIEKTASGTIIATGPDGVGRFRALVIAQACELWANHGIKANRAYTPTAMLKAASGITGIVYKRGQHAQAAKDIRDCLLIGCTPEQMAAREAQG